MNIHHIGYLVKKAPKAQAAFEALGYIAEGEWTHDEIRKVDILFLQKDGYRIELVSPYAPDSVVSGLIRTYKNAPYHLCYEAENFEKELAELEEAILCGADLRQNEVLAAHADWAEEFLTRHSEVNAENIHEIVQQEIGLVFMQVLEDAGVYKCTEDGRKGFERFIDRLNA